jgi:hypothetical protein
MRFTGIHGLVLEAREPVEKAVLTVLASSFPNRLPFPAVCAMVNQTLAEAGLRGPQDFSALHEFLHRLVALDALDVLVCGNGEWLRSGDTAGPSPLMRYQAEKQLPLANRWHEPVDLTPEGRSALTNSGVPLDKVALMRAGLLV